MTHLAPTPVPTPTPRAAPAPSTAAAAILAVVFLGAQIVWILDHRTGPFIDEGTYATAGLRTLDGFGVSDGYQSWFAGSLIWPAISGAAYRAGGLDASRITAAVCITLACWASVRAGQNLFGTRTGFWTAALVLGSAPALSLAHLAVYDVLAAMFLGGAFWAVSRLVRDDNRGWLIAVSLFSTLAILSKYPLALMVAVLLVLVVALRGRRGVTDALIISAVVTGGLMAYFLPFRLELSQFVGWRTEHDPNFGVLLRTIAFEQALILVPVLVVVVIGTVLLPPGRRLAGGVMAGALVLFPMYHMVIENSVGASKHALFGLLLATPVAGHGLSHLTGWRRWPAAAAAMLAATVVLGAMTAGAATMTLRGDQGWLDMRPATNYLVAHMRSGDTVVSSNSWPVVPELFRRGLVATPAQVTDGWAVTQRPAPIDWCSFDFVIDEQNGTGWSDDQRAQINSCSNLRKVIDARSPMTALGQDLRYVHWHAGAVVWQRIR